MSHKRIPKRKAVIAAGSVVALGAAALFLPNAMASQTDATTEGAAPRTMQAADASDLASQLAELLGEDYAGAYYDSGKQQLIINVVGDNNNVVVQAEKAGAVVREVENSTTELTAASQTLKAEATIPGTSWAVDPRTNKIQVTADSTVTGANWDQLESTVQSLGSGMATIKKSAGEFKTFVEGGDAIFGGGARCSLGFNVVADDGSPAFLTAGHCGVAAAEWSDSEAGAPIGTVDAATFPGDGDFALVKYDDPATQAPSTVNVGQQSVEITQAAEAAVGQQVIRMGSTTGLDDGQVTGLDATVNYPEGTVTGLIQTDVCAEPGDSGGSLFTEDGSAIGLTSGGSGDCTIGGETFFQPVTTALAAVGAQIGAGDAGEEAGGAGGAGEEAGGAGEEAGGAGEEAGGAVGGAGAGEEVGGGQEIGGEGQAGDQAGDAGDQTGEVGDQVGDGVDDGSGLTHNQ